jgi:hypothetical protein
VVTTEGVVSVVVGENGLFRDSCSMCVCVCVCVCVLMQLVETATGQVKTLPCPVCFRLAIHSRISWDTLT